MGILTHQTWECDFNKTSVDGEFWIIHNGLSGRYLYFFQKRPVSVLFWMFVVSSAPTSSIYSVHIAKTSVVYFAAFEKGMKL